MIAALQDSVPLAYVNRLEDLREFPPAFKTWVLSQLTDDLEEPIDQGSDRAWFFNAARAWFMSVQHVELRNGTATLVTDLADRPMNGTTLVFQDIGSHTLLLASQRRRVRALRLRAPLSRRSA